MVIHFVSWSYTTCLRDHACVVGSLMLTQQVSCWEMDRGWRRSAGLLQLNGISAAQHNGVSTY